VGPCRPAQGRPLGAGHAHSRADRFAPCQAGHVDHTIYDTGSIARFLVRRFGLKTLPGLVERDKAMLAAGGPPPGDLTAAGALKSG
jgi:phospholipase C